MAEPEPAVLVGYRFHPTDEELVNFYLRNKNLGRVSAVKQAINEIDICKHDPWDLPWKSKLPSDDSVWFFFCPRVSKCSNSKRICRTTKAGYWKGTGVDRKIKAKRNGNVVIGTKKTLVFYEGRVPNGKRTDWVMHEYQSTLPLEQRTFVLCKVKDKKGEKTGISSYNGTESSYSLASESYNLAAVNTPIEVNQPVQELPESFLDHGLSVDELGVLLEDNTEFHHSVGPSEQDGLSLAELEGPNGITSHYNVQRPSDVFTDADRNFLNGSEQEDRRFLDEQFVNQDCIILETSMYEHYSAYEPPPPLTGVCDDSYSSDSDAESITAGSYQEVSSSGDSVGSSEENNQIPDNGIQNDGSADSLSSTNSGKSHYYESEETSDADEHSTRIQFQGKAMHSEAPIKTREAIDQESTEELSEDKEPTVVEAREKTSTRRNVKEKGSYVMMEMVEICRKPDQLFASLLNVVVGSILFAVTIRGIWSLH